MATADAHKNSDDPNSSHDLAKISALQREVASLPLAIPPLLRVFEQRIREMTGAHRCEIILTEKFADLPPSPDPPAASELSLPLYDRGKCIGVVRLQHAEKNAFDARKTTLLEVITGLLSSSLRHARDLVSRFQALSDLKTSEEKFRKVVEGAYDAIVVTENGRAIEVNPAFTTIFGYTAAEALAQTSAVEVLAPEVRARTAEFIRTGYERPYESVGLHRDGHRFPIEVTGKMVIIGDRRVRVTTINDISERRRAEAKLQETHARLEMLFSASPVGILVMDPRLHVTLWNPACERMYGWTREEALGKPLPFVPAERRAESDALMHRMAKTREKVEVRASRVRKDGTAIQTQIAAMPLFSEAGELQGFLGMMTDVSDQARVEETLRRAEEEARASARAKSEFLANMSHEIRTPITGVVGMSALLQDTALLPEQRDYLGRIQSAAASLLGVVNDILDFSRIEAGRLEFEKIPFAPATVAEEVRGLLALAAKTKGLEFSVETTPETPDFFLGDPLRLRQVLTNLANNAIKFTESGRVHLRLRGTAGALHGEVIDTGIGIAPDVIAKIFQSFTQADNSTQRKFGGSGLGLSICKSLVEQMGGTIGVESAGPGTGARFWFAVPLPVTDTAPVLAAPAPQGNTVTTPTPAREKVRILIVEDVPTNQLIARKMLEKLGYASDVAANGKLALDALARHPYDLILMDCQMPEMDGYEATRRIRSGDHFPNPKLPIIAMTANALPGDAEKCLAAGMSDYLAKPVPISQLQTLLEKWLGLAA